MTTHGHGESQVTGGPAVETRLALALETDLLPITDPCRDLHADWLALGGLQPHGVAVDGREEIESGARGLVAALRGTTGPTESARGLAEAALAEHPAEDIVETTRATGALPATLAALSEHPTEDIFEAGALAGSSGSEACATGAHGPHLVVFFALIGIREHGVRLADLLELRLGRHITRVGIRMILACELAVGLLEVCCRNVLGDAENGVEVLVKPILAGHRRLLSYTVSGRVA